jgi:hypothetical protein
MSCFNYRVIYPRLEESAQHACKWHLATVSPQLVWRRLSFYVLFVLIFSSDENIAEVNRSLKKIGKELSSITKKIKKVVKISLIHQQVLLPNIGFQRKLLYEIKKRSYWTVKIYCLEGWISYPSPSSVSLTLYALWICHCAYVYDCY